MRGTDKARELRRGQTDAEARLWWHLRDRRLGGYKFRRQCPFGRFVVDFVCIDRKLIVELDGGQHADRANYDGQRTALLNRYGYTVVRYWDDDALLRTDRVLEDILMHLALAGPAAPHPNPLPAGGERETLGERNCQSPAKNTPSSRARGEGRGEGQAFGQRNCEGAAEKTPSPRNGARPGVRGRGK